ncbi:hypothetical protein NE237_022675 [Protea cynaroides]|uniref:Uncharacterized protein n=1 Tax=Protea cynaroides TaxID=273540 RepID=A0A9Q0HA41_9MAGN|nr:hypothetical protein NE237_022675 [Protea cynaroides]
MLPAKNVVLVLNLLTMWPTIGRLIRLFLVKGQWKAPYPDLQSENDGDGRMLRRVRRSLLSSTASDSAFLPQPMSTTGITKGVIPQHAYERQLEKFRYALIGRMTTKGLLLSEIKVVVASSGDPSDEDNPPAIPTKAATMAANSLAAKTSSVRWVNFMEETEGSVEEKGVIVPSEDNSAPQLDNVMGMEGIDVVGPSLICNVTSPPARHELNILASGVGCNNPPAATTTTTPVGSGSLIQTHSLAAEDSNGLCLDLSLLSVLRTMFLTRLFPLRHDFIGILLRFENQIW